MSNSHIKHADTLDTYSDIAWYVRDAAYALHSGNRSTEEAREALEMYAEAYPGSNAVTAEDAEGLADAWATLANTTAISEEYFTEYVQEYLEDLGALESGFSDVLVINWRETADNVRNDYTEFDLDGVTYLIRL